MGIRPAIEKLRLYLFDMDGPLYPVSRLCGHSIDHEKITNSDLMD